MARGEQIKRACVAAVLAGAVCVQVFAEPAEEGWDTTVAAGFNMTSGNSDALLGKLSITSTRDSGENLVRSGVEGSYGETKVENDDGSSQTETTAENAKGFANYRRTFNGSYAVLDASAVYDKVAEVDYRAMIGPGLGYFLYRSETAQLTAEAGAAYLWESVDDVEDDYPVFRLAERYELKCSGGGKLWEQVEYVPKTDDFADYLLTAEAGLEAPATPTMSLRVVVQDKYDSLPAEGQDKNDVTVTAALVWKL